MFTDEVSAYAGLDAKGYEHRRVNCSAGVFAVGDVHTNTIDGFRSLVQRGSGGGSLSRKEIFPYELA